MERRRTRGDGGREGDAGDAGLMESRGAAGREGATQRRGDGALIPQWVLRESGGGDSDVPRGCCVTTVPACATHSHTELGERKKDEETALRV